MKHKYIFIISAIVLLVSSLCIGVCVITGYPLDLNSKPPNYVKEIITGLEGKTIPDIELLLPDSTTLVNTALIPSGKPIVLFYFGPYCSYCQIEMVEIISNIKYLENIQFYLISPYSIVDIRKFSTAYNIEKYRNVVVGMDRKYNFGRYFKTENIPFLAIYNSDRKLKAVFSRNVKYDQIKAVCEE